jgi:glutaminyl-peptide cyclotransferase
MLTLSLRALAASWEGETNPAMTTYGYPTFLNQISLFVLLDLLGTANTNIPSQLQITHWAYQGMATIEERMRKLRLLETNPSSVFLNDSNKMAAQFVGEPVHDDHVSFLARGVPVLPVIPGAASSAWQATVDDGDTLDMPTVRDWSKIITAFAFEWLDMMEVMPSKPKRRR